MNVLELIGVAAFAVTGAIAAMEKGADVFGVLFLSLITALGGGVIRDLLLGVHPPRMFASFAYVALALGCGLVFFLGALCFKKSKVGKTILCLFAFSTVLSTLSMVFFGQYGPTYINVFDSDVDPVQLLTGLNWFLNIYFIVVIGGLMGGIYYRLRTLKH